MSEPAHASCNLRRSGFAKTWPNDRVESATRALSPCIVGPVVSRCRNNTTSAGRFQEGRPSTGYVSESPTHRNARKEHLMSDTNEKVDTGKDEDFEGHRFDEKLEEQRLDQRL